MRETQNGSGHAPMVAVIATVALSVVLFFVFTLPNSKKGKGEPAPGDGGAASAASDPIVPDGGDGSGDPDAGDPPPEPAIEVPAADDFAASPGALMDELTKRLDAGDLDSLAELLGESAGGASALAAAFGPEGYGPAPGDPPREVGPVGDAVRWALPVTKRPAAEAAPATPPPAAETAAERVYLDLVQSLGADRKPSWSVAKVHFPPALQDLIDAASPQLVKQRNEEDAVIMADGFITAVTQKDFVTALRDCSPDTVPEEKIAGLCIVFEEGQFALRADRPLVATALGDDKAWVIAHVVSPKLDEGSEFGLVMRRGVNGDAGWQITEINFGKLLESYVTASDAGKVPYTPIRSEPGAGELLVLYFEYDEQTLLPRAKRQLEILSSILKADPGKKLVIAGHADALGSEDYNARLSATRAAAVKTQLIVFGVPENQVLTRGFGEAKPWKPNERPDGSDDPKGRAYNRRAEIFLDFERVR